MSLAERSSQVLRARVLGLSFFSENLQLKTYN